jgi:LuxR family maltose regulon positive regulatory protein
LDYLLHEVLSHVPPEIEEFLVKTSILDTLYGPLCDAVTDADGGAGRGQSNLEMLEETNLFTVALDEQGLWYRYHHLFQGLLRSRLTHKLDAHAIDALHCRASAWYASHDYLEAALEHALAGHDLAGAEQLVAQHRHHLLDTEQRPRLQRWLRAFPDDAVAHSPELLLAKAWSTAPGRADSHTVLAQVDQAQALIEQMTGAPERARQLQGEIDTLRSIEKGFAANNPQGVIALTTRALETMPQAWYWVRATAWLQLAIAYQLAGQLERAYTVLAAGQLEDTAVIHAPRVRVAGAGALIDWMAGDLSRFIQTSQTVVGISHAANLHESLGYGHCFLATACYQRNNLAAAEEHASIVQAQRYAGDPIAVAQSAFILAMVHQARGRPEEARLVLAHVNDYLLEARSEALLPAVQAFGADLAAMQGDLATAGEWAATVGPLLPFSIMAFFYAPQLALPRILIRLDTPASRRQAAAALARVEAFVTATHNTRYTIDVLALQALCAAAEGNAPAALQMIEQAVRLAQPGGFIRVFVDLGPAMADLLERLARRSAAVDYIRQILDAFPAASAPAASAPSPSRRPTIQPVLVEPLSNRELEVLALLAQRQSAKEIAQHLTISERTAKRHTANIYQKLAVNNRRAAVATASTLGILPAGQ